MKRASPENRAPEVPRDDRGRIRPGHTLNPGGRPKVLAEFRNLARDRSPDALEVLHSIATDPGKQDRDRIAAANAILDRAWGRPGPEEPGDADPESRPGLNLPEDLRRWLAAQSFESDRT